MCIGSKHAVYITFFFQKQNGRVNDYVVSNVMGSKEAYEYTLPANGKVIEEVETGEKTPPPSQPGKMVTIKFDNKQMSG